MPTSTNRERLRARLRIVAAAIVTFTAVLGAQQRDAAKLPAAQASAAVSVLKTWFECDECEAGELAAVVKLGEPVVPILGAVLRGGLSPATRELVRGQLADRYD